MKSLKIFFPKTINLISTKYYKNIRSWTCDRFLQEILIPKKTAKPHSSVSSNADLRTGGCWFNPRLDQYSLWGLMIVIVTGFIPLSLLSVVWVMVMLESSQWLGKNIVRRAWIGALAATVWLKYCRKWHWTPCNQSINLQEILILNPFPNRPWFLRVCSTSLLKTLREKEKLLVTSNFSFSHCVFYWFVGTLYFFHWTENCHLQTVSVWKSLKFVVWERVKKIRLFSATNSCLFSAAIQAFIGL